MQKGTLKQSIFNVIKGVLFSLIISVVLILILAVIAKYTDISDKTISAINQVIKVVALLFGILLGVKNQKGGLIVGAIVGLLYTLLSFAIFSAISGKLTFDKITVFDFLICIAVGAISGILTVNLKGLKKGEKRRMRQARVKAH